MPRSQKSSDLYLIVYSKNTMDLRREWTTFVAKTKKKGNRGKSQMTHKEAMKEASKTWVKEREKIIRRHSRAYKKQSESKPPSRKLEELPCESD
mgnify:CR=1 FL=1|jgi:hypothetical protein